MTSFERAWRALKRMQLVCGSIDKEGGGRRVNAIHRARMIYAELNGFLLRCMPLYRWRHDSEFAQPPHDAEFFTLGGDSILREAEEVCPSIRQLWEAHQLGELSDSCFVGAYILVYLQRRHSQWLGVFL